MPERGISKDVFAAVNGSRSMLAIVLLAVALSGWSLRSFPPKPEVIFERTTVEGIGLELRLTARDQIVPDASVKPCGGKRHPELFALDLRTTGQQRSGALADFGAPGDAFQDRSGLLSVASWSGGSRPNGESTFAFTLVRAGPAVARVRASFLGEATDDMHPVHGWAALALRASVPAAGALSGTIEALDGSGRVIATVDQTSRRRSACLQDHAPADS